METNSFKHNWDSYDIGQIIGGTTPDGVRLLKLFLIDYTALFGETVNPSCSKCMDSYLSKYKLKIFEMQNNSQYRLKEKYNGLPLNFGSPVLVNNSNLTDEYASELLKRFDADVIFEKFPKVKPEFIPSLKDNEKNK